MMNVETVNSVPEDLLPPPTPLETDLEPADIGVVPLSGSILEPAFHLMEVEFARPVSAEVLTKALTSMGFGSVVADQSIAYGEPSKEPAPSVAEMWRRWVEWGAPSTPLESGSDRPVRYRFVTHVEAPLVIQNTGFVKWIYDHALALNPFEEGAEKLTSHELVHGGVYDLRFLARMKSRPTRASICESLAIMGFHPYKILALRRNMRIPGRPNASVTRWFALAKWEGADGYITAEDPLFFEEVAQR